MWDLIVSVPDHCLSFYLLLASPMLDVNILFVNRFSKFLRHILKGQIL